MSSKRDFDYLIFIGRFQPLHVGHQYVIDKALELADRVIVLVGSATTARSPRNPFTFGERKEMIEQTFRSVSFINDRLHVTPISDTSQDNRWMEQVQRQVYNVLERDLDVKLHGLGDRRIGLIGYAKDNSSYYLRMFPQWESVDVQPEGGPFNATDIRNSYFTSLPDIPARWLSTATVSFLDRFVRTPEFKDILKDASYIAAYHKSWDGAPFPPTFVTVDNVCVQSGHVLLVKRGDHPGKGLWALPGGFINIDEPLKASAIRELREETLISDHLGRIPPAKLEGFIQEDRTKVYDDPNRSARGRTITHAFYYEFPDAKPMFTVEGADDAAAAAWVPFGELVQETMFEDHYLILEDMLNLKGAF
ncbi:bifunctional nicotinamide-nucleotide adenylyltransferase/Nudix hydroxylase [Sinorhizobium meliloti]|uniref:bifunctional nicotinamide-nucleotide adenylyltransferase/Nudix hydroxylase n=1 Tax=Rhizobium meliloti TaxID=382 RepID=UPI0018659DD3|nr:bifunctional nicotinamide-nucleotide adenylyltransferase/Nudix hydroxylase [Sinorhizobium meliloti]